MMTSYNKGYHAIPTKIDGFYIIVLMLIIVFIAGLVIKYSLQLTNTSDIQAQKSMSNQAYYSALSALEVGTFLLTSPKLTSPNVYEQRKNCSNLNTTIPFSGGELNVSGTELHSTATELSTSIDEASTIIPVLSLTGLAEQGRIIINNENIDYFDTSNDNPTCNGFAPCLIHIKRGTGNSTVQAHATASKVAQFQCKIQGIGSLPSLANPKAQKILTRTIQLQRAWVAGEKLALNGFVASWDNGDWTENGGIPNENIRDIDALSYGDVWAVGDDATIIHFDGNNWSSYPVFGSEDINAISCVSQNDCWATGDKGRFYRYNGASWSLNIALPLALKVNGIDCPASDSCWAVGNTGFVYRYTFLLGWVSLPSLTLQNLNAVHCTSVNNCWAVGNSGKIAHWTGLLWQLDDVGSKDILGITCTSSTNCWAVGEDKYFYRYNGTNWILSIPPAIPSADYHDVSCYHETDCWAVGNEYDDNALLAHWDGDSWEQITYPTLPEQNLYAIETIGPNQMSAIFNDDVVR